MWFASLLTLYAGCSAITVEVGEREVWMAQQFEWGDACGGDPDGERPLVLSWLEEEGIHPIAVERRAGVTDPNSCWAHRETVYVLVSEVHYDRLDAMGFTLRMPPAR